MNFDRVMEELKKAIYGKDEILEKILLCILAKGHILLEDIPGVGKTTIALAFSKVFDLDFKRMQFTSDVMPSDILGYTIYNRETNKFARVDGPIFCNLFLADEINRTSAKTQSALLEAMEEHKVTVENEVKILEEPFFTIATQNPHGSGGTNILPQSQMDRFLMATSIGYPCKEAEIGILKSRHKENPIEHIEKVMSKKELLEIRKVVDDVYVEDSIYDYVLRLVERTRTTPQILIGVSPRGTLALIRVAKAKAFMNHRDYVLPKDIQDVFVDVCTHRIVLRTRDQSCISKERASVLKNILDTTAEPVMTKRGK